MAADFITEDIRLTVLRLLDRAGGSLNSAVLLTGVRRYGHKVGLDRIAEEMRWLAAQGLISVDPAGELLVGSLLYRGQDVARGHARHPGVKEPLPGLE